MATELEADQLKILQRNLHAAVDRVIDEFLAKGRPGREGDGFSDELAVTPLEGTAEWTYRWPDGVKEVFFKSRWYELAAEKGIMRVRVAWTRRPAWGREDRARAIVFHQIGSEDSTTYYPWTEFVETDDERYAAPIPDPHRPRAMLSSTDDLPSRFETAVVERSDQVFESITNGPSLRLVVQGDQEDAMVRHGHWVAALRNRI